MAKFFNTYHLKEDIRVILAFMSGGFLLGAIICFLAVKVFGANDPEITTAQIASVFAIAAGGIFLMIFEILGLKNRFGLSVGMSQTRKKFICRESVETVLETITVLLLGFLLYKIDYFMQNTLYRGLRVELDIRFLFADFLRVPLNFITIVLAVLGIRFLFGVLFMKFGQKFVWGCWALWMLLALGSQRIARDYLKDFKGTVEFLSSASKLLGGYFWQAIVCIAASVLFGIACLMLRKQEAKGY